MTAPSTVCPECGEDVPFGRRTCEACGADVTGVTHVMETAIEDVPAEAVADEEAAPAGVDGWDTPAAAVEWPGDRPTAEAEVTSPAAAAPATSAPAARHEPELIGMEREAAEPQTAEPASAPFVPPVLREWNPGSPHPETGFAAELAAAEAEPTGLAGAWLPPSATPSALPETPSMEYRAAAPQPAASAAPVDIPPQAAAAEPPGAMPATLAAMLNRTSTGTPRWPGEDGGATGRENESAAAAPMTAPSRMPDLGRSVPPAAMTPSQQRSLEPGRAPLFADLPFDAPNTLPGWLVAGGGAIATVSFLLPWVAVLDSYFTSWGLGSIANLPAFLVVFGTTALAILPSRLADWLRHGILGLAVGSFILGLTWNRLVGATGGQIGVILEGTGALLLLIGGILAIVRDRGTTDGPAERR